MCACVFFKENYIFRFFFIWFYFSKGSPEQIAKLLVLQRQGEFIQKTTASVITNAVFRENDVLEFEFETPLPGLQEVTRKTAAKAYFRCKNNTFLYIFYRNLCGDIKCYMLSDQGEEIG